MTHLGSAWVVDTLRGKNSSSMALGSLSVCQAYRPFVPGDSTSVLHDIESAFGGVHTFCGNSEIPRVQHLVEPR